MNGDRFSMSAEEYLSQTYVLTYIEDAVSQLLEFKEEFSKVGIARFLAEYFNSVQHGSHILFREFTFIIATPYNRASFIRMFWRCFRQIGKNGDLLTVKEYHSLLQLICQDFPMDLAQKAARIVLMDDAMDCPMSFVDFLYAFQIQICYCEFLESIAVIYQDLLMGKNPNAVIVPTSSVQQHRLLSNDTATQEGVDASQFYEWLETFCERYKHNYPPTPHMKQILHKVQRVTFFGFVMTLAKHEGINCKLGILPSKSELLIDSDMDRELEKVIEHMLSNQTSSAHVLAQKEPSRKVGHRKTVTQRKKVDIESDGSTEETDSSEN
ncbi:centriolar satellite-associated tubulin polyglutamylase complex regulator 1 isoform X2 [Scyliorhinus torazame]|uniref:centriolar satellite-associated tubulin polyglutamylase complex regulator 1 isoform X2 n=1 Tax=Scyliorhinus torazame TaxID=75743 RepID=UPI003B5BDDD8